MTSNSITTSTVDLQRARLRLAARTLVEWRTPHSSKYYRGVLEALIDTSAIAKACGLSREHEIISLDEHGSLLWYLSDTLMTDSAAAWVPVLPITAGRQMAARSFAVFEHSTEIDEFSNAWISKYNVGEVLDIIYGGLVSDTNERYHALAITVLLAIVSPICYREQSIYIRELVAFRSPVASTVRRIRHRIRRLYDGFEFAISAFTAALISFTGTIFLVYVVFTLPDVRIVLDKITAVRSFDQLLDVVTGSSLSSILIVFNILTTAIYVNTRVNKRWITNSLNRLFLFIAGASQELKETMFRPQFMTSLVDAFGTQCGQNPEAWRSAMNAGDAWMAVALSATKVASISVIRVAMRSLESVSITRDAKKMIFCWLCQVTIVK